MDGYLQALIDRYNGLLKVSTGEKRAAYIQILTDLHNMAEYTKKQPESHTSKEKGLKSTNAPTVEDFVQDFMDEKKHSEGTNTHPYVVAAFKGTSKELTEYLKKLRKEG